MESASDHDGYNALSYIGAPASDIEKRSLHADENSATIEDDISIVADSQHELHGNAAADAGAIDTPAESSRSDISRRMPELYTPTFSDHYSLKAASSTVKFHSGNIHVHSQTDSQYILEERVALIDENGGGNTDGSNQFQYNISVKRSDTSSHGESVVRALYSAIAIFVGATVFIYAIGLVLFLISDVALELQEWDATKLFPFFGVLFALPTLFGGLTYFLVLTTGFVVDVFSGHPLLHLFGWGSVQTNWASFLAFGGVPLFTLIGSLFAQSRRVLEVTLISSFISACILLLLFAKAVCALLIQSSLDLVQEYEGRKMSSFEKLKSAVWISARSRLSGKQQDLRTYGSEEYCLIKQCSTEESEESDIYMSTGRLWLKLTQLPFLSCMFERLEVPQRRWTHCEISGALPFLTKYSWGLESVFCRVQSRSAVAVIGGSSAITSRQATSSSICFVLGNTVSVLLLAAALVWFQVTAWVILVITGLFAAYRCQMMRRRVKLARRVNERINYYKDKTTNEKGYGLVQRWECYTITRPKDALVSAFLFLNLIVCFIYPFAFLCWSKNIVGALTFIVMAFMHFQQTSLDSIQIFEELGSFAFRRERNHSVVHPGKDWRNKSRLYHITSLNIFRGMWSRALGAFVWLFVVVALAAVITSSTSGDGASEQSTTATNTTSLSQDRLDPWFSFPNSTFFYQEPQLMNHPKCLLESSESSSDIQYLADYAFLANLPYFKTETIQPLLDDWFGEGIAVHHNAQAEFRKSHPEFSSYFVSYELVSFPDDLTAVVLVRGTKTFFDYLADAKIWYSTALFQVFRASVPFGEFFTPLIRFNIRVLSMLERASIQKYAYYVETTEFINYIKDQYDKVLITGHSLGGGIALISGTQTQSTAVGLSAPNTVLGRETVNPKLELDDLKKYTFNIVPERDIFPKIGDQLAVENIKCRADTKDSFSCHDAHRSLCEMLYSCGTVKRPVYCECVAKMGYPEPLSVDNNGMSFEEACSAKAD